jgi:transcriptional regulator of acetoin/glycerol metabolism
MILSQANEGRNNMHLIVISQRIGDAQVEVSGPKGYLLQSTDVLVTPTGVFWFGTFVAVDATGGRPAKLSGPDDKAMILKALRQEGSITKAAEALDVATTTLQKAMRRHGIKFEPTATSEEE